MAASGGVEVTDYAGGWWCADIEFSPEEMALPETQFVDLVSERLGEVRAKLFKAKGKADA